MTRIRLGVVSYLNALPLWWTLRERADIELIPAVPARLCDLLAEGRIDAGLLPIIEYFRVPDLHIVPGAAIGARGDVLSVRLFHRTPPSELRSVRLDADSRTSCALARIILEDGCGVKPEYCSGRVLPGELANMAEDAALIIGDPALEAWQNAALPSLDLGAEWAKLTGLPFVFAAWLTRAEGAPPFLADLLTSAAREGKARIADIVKGATSPAARVLGRETIERYLREHIDYDFGDAQRLGVEEFARRAAAKGLCERRPA